MGRQREVSASKYRMFGLGVGFSNKGLGVSDFTIRHRLFPFRKRSLPFLTVDAIIGNQAFSIAECNFVLWIVL